jgi:hypothetical protein
MQIEQLVDAPGLLTSVWPENCRPSLRWIRDQQKQRTLPFIKIGRKVFFDPNEVRRALIERQTLPSGRTTRRIRSDEKGGL